MTSASLQATAPEDLAIRRRRRGRGFEYLDAQGKRLTDAAALERIRSLAIPPAYREVRIACEAEAHLQAIGRDDAGRLQYRYHPGWEKVRARRKDRQIERLCRALPKIRGRIARDLRGKALSRDRVLAAVVMLIDKTHIRIGCEGYVHSGRSRGAATLTKRNAACDGDRICLRFTGKGGRNVACEVKSAPLGRVLAQLSTLPGRRLFQYRDSSGRRRRVTAAEVNDYLQEIAGAAVTAKDFRTLAASAAAADMLARVRPGDSVRARRKQVAEAVEAIADMLGNTPAVARKSYVLPCVTEAFLSGKLQRSRRKSKAGLSKSEALIGRLLE